MRIVDNVFDSRSVQVSLSDFANEYFDHHASTWTNYFKKAEDALHNLLSTTLNRNEKRLIRKVLKSFKFIITATPSEIPGIIKSLETPALSKLLYDGSLQTEFGKKIELAFNYKSFRGSAKASWLSERYNIKACLYCNAQYCLTVGRDGVTKKLLFQFDHFYNKNRYPYLSLTLGNLIPSCSTCNIAKSKKEFGDTTHLHPFAADANTAFSFYVDENDVFEYLFGKRDRELLQPKLKITDTRYKQHDQVFHLTKIYHKHSDVVEELILKSLYYNQSKRNELQREFGDLLDKSTIDRFVLGNYTLDSEINRRPLSKLSKDIGKQLKIIDI